MQNRPFTKPLRPNIQLSIKYIIKETPVAQFIAKYISYIQIREW